LIITILVITFNIFLLIFPKIVLTAARDGLMLWFNNVLPSLLPFMIATNMLILLGFVNFAGRALSPVMRFLFKLPGAAGFGFITGLTSGYPMGAKTVADLRRSNQLALSEAQHLLAFSNNAGPLFIVGVVGVGLFESARAGYVLWAGHVLAAIVLGILLRPKTRPEGGNFLETASPTRPSENNTGQVLGEAVKNAMESMALIGGLIIFFSVVVALAEYLVLPSDALFGGIFAGLAEVTGGVRRLAAPELSIVTLGAAAFVIGFGGFSVHAQSFHFTAGTGIKILPYLIAKVGHGVIAATFTVILWSVLQ